MRFYLIFGAFLRELILSCGIAVLQNFYKKFRVISMRFAVFLYYCVRCLYVFLCGFVLNRMPPHPPYAPLY